MLRQIYGAVKILGILGTTAVIIFAYSALEPSDALYISVALGFPLIIMLGLDRKYNQWSQERDRLNRLSPQEYRAEALQNNQIIPLLGSMFKGAFMFIGASVLVLLTVRLLSLFF